MRLSRLLRRNCKQQVELHDQLHTIHLTHLYIYVEATRGNFRSTVTLVYVSRICMLRCRLGDSLANIRPLQYVGAGRVGGPCDNYIGYFLGIQNYAPSVVAVVASVFCSLALRAKCKMHITILSASTMKCRFGSPGGIRLRNACSSSLSCSGGTTPLHAISLESNM